MIEIEEGVDEVRLPLPRRIVSGIGSVVCMSAAFYGALCAVDGTFRSIEPYHAMPAFIESFTEPLHTAVEFVAPSAVTHWASGHLEQGWKGVGEMAVGMLANWVCRPLGEGLCDEALSERS